MLIIKKIFSWVKKICLSDVIIFLISPIIILIFIIILIGFSCNIIYSPLEFFHISDCYEQKLELLERTNYYQNKCMKNTIDLTVDEFKMCKDLQDKRNAKLTFHPEECNKFSKKLVNAIKKVESNYNPRAISNKGAMGIMQIKYETAKSVGYKGTPEGLLDHEINTKYSCIYLNKIYNRFDDIYITLDAYYRGPGNVIKNPWNKSWEEHPYVGKILMIKGGKK